MGHSAARAKAFQTGDFVYGTVAFQGADYGMYGTFAAESSPAGEDPGGRVDLDTLFGTRDDIRGPVTCLRVSEHRAVMAVDNESGADVLLYLHADPGNAAMYLAPPRPTCPSVRIRAWPPA